MFSNCLRRLYRNIPFLLSSPALCFLLMTSPRFLPDVVLLGIGLVVLALFLPLHPQRLKRSKRRLSDLLTILIALYLAGRFYLSMNTSSALAALSAKVGLPQNLTVILIAILAAGCASYVLAFFSIFLTSHVRMTRSRSTPPQFSHADTRSERIRAALVCVITAVTVVTICSQSSPLYPLNKWVDANCYFTTGKGMLHGMVPYRDLYEHKGPLIYFYHALAALVSYRSFLGVYLLEIVTCIWLLSLCRRILRLYHRSSSLLWLPIIAATIYTTTCFAQGDSAEEWLMPHILYGLYVFLRVLHHQTDFTRKEGILIGITSSFVLWTKFNMLGMYIGLFIAFVLIRASEKNWASVFRLVGNILIGITCVTLPILLYFGLNGALIDLWNVYFYDNLFRYTNPWGAGLSLLYGYNVAYAYNFWAVLCILLAVLGFSSSGLRKQSLTLSGAILGLFVSVFIGGVHHMYYSFIFSVFTPLGVACIEEYVHRVRLRLFGRPALLRRALPYVLTLLCVVLAYGKSENTCWIGVPKQDLPQYQFAEIIQQSDDQSLLNYGFLDGGFYTTAGVLPTNRFFCRNNMPLQEMWDAQDASIANSETEFVVTRDEPLDSPNYTLIAQAHHPLDLLVDSYYLYQRTDSVSL